MSETRRARKRRKLSSEAPNDSPADITNSSPLRTTRSTRSSAAKSTPKVNGDATLLSLRGGALPERPSDRDNQHPHPGRGGRGSGRISRRSSAQKDGVQGQSVLGVEEPSATPQRSSGRVKKPLQRLKELSTPQKIYKTSPRRGNTNGTPVRKHKDAIPSVNDSRVPTDEHTPRAENLVYGRQSKPRQKRGNLADQTDNSYNDVPLKDTPSLVRETSPPEDALERLHNGQALSATQDQDDSVRQDKRATGRMNQFKNDDHPRNPVLSSTAHGENTSFGALRQISLAKLARRRTNALQNLDDELAIVSALVSATVTAGESNSLLILGSRGTGKTALVNKVIDDLNEDSATSNSFHVIRLNGFIQTDDKLALREIWRQLGRSMDLEDKEDGTRRGKSYADALATFLALLSHSADMPEIESDSSAQEMTKSVVFVLDEFDQFTSRPRQTLLYNLFDIAQSRKAPIAVLGLSSRIDVTDSLEKRVKSRFSHRLVYLSPSRSLKVYLDIAKATAQVQYQELSNDEQAKLVDCQPDQSPKGRVNSLVLENEPVTQAIKQWNLAVDALFEDETTQKALGRIYHMSKSIPSALTALYIPVSQLVPNSKNLRAAFSCDVGHLQQPSSQTLIHLPSLSTLSLALLVAAARLPLLYQSDLVNFPLAYEEYVSLCNKARLSTSASGTTAAGGVAGRIWSKAVAKTSWEGLVHLGFLIPVNESASLGLAGHGVGSLQRSTGASDSIEMMRIDVALEEIDMAIGADLEPDMTRWCKDL